MKLFFVVLTFVFSSLQVWAGAAPARKTASHHTPHRWAVSGEVCVVYDFRPLLDQKKSGADFFALELKNHNGGSIENRYSVQKYKKAKDAFSAVLKDVAKYTETGRCDGLEVFYPQKENDSSPL